MKNIINKVLGLSFAICCVVNCDGANAVENQNENFEVRNGELTMRNRNIETIDIPESVTSLPSCCFQNCSSLSSVTIPSCIIYLKITVSETAQVYLA
jgi:hypothetical protein